MTVIIISSTIYICFCIMHCIYVGILFTRAPTDSRALSSDWTTLVLGLLFIFFHIPLQSLSEGLLIAMIMFLVNLVEML